MATTMWSKNCPNNIYLKILLQKIEAGEERAWLASLAREEITKEIIVDYVSLARSKAHLVSLSTNDMVNVVLPPSIINDLWF